MVAFKQKSHGVGGPLVGKISCEFTAKQIEKAFGDGEISPGPCNDKVTYEWFFTDDGRGRYRIYDYSFGTLLDHQSYHWHIGANHPKYPWGDFGEWFVERVKEANGL